MFQKTGVLNISQDLQEKTTLRENCPNTELFLVCIFPYLDYFHAVPLCWNLFILKYILQVFPCELCKIFKRTFIYKYLEHLGGVLTRYCVSISTQIIFNKSFIFGMFLILREMIFVC